MIKEHTGHFDDFTVHRKDIKGNKQISSMLELRIINAWDVQDSSKSAVAKSIASSIKNNLDSSRHYDLYLVLYVELYAGNIRSSQEFVFKKDEL